MINRHLGISTGRIGRRHNTPKGFMIPNVYRQAHLKRAGPKAAKKATAMLVHGSRAFRIFGELRLRDMHRGAGEIEEV